ncbi:MAG: hypothetical protein IEMM0008_1298 [bacterium]|nr:MAG: hypothetical protein IEMM0008_1298 [bacterium]
MGLREQARFARMGLREKAKHFINKDLSSVHLVDYTKIFNNSGETYPIKLQEAVNNIISICLDQLSLKEAVLVLYQPTKGVDDDKKTYRFAVQYG